MISLSSPIETPWHKVPAAYKLAVLALATVVLFRLDTLGAQLYALLLCAALYGVCGYRFASYGVNRLRLLWPFLLLLLVWHSVSGTVITGGLIALRLVTTVALANLVTMTTQLGDIMAVLRVLLTPLRKIGISSKPIELAIALVIRFTPVLLEKSVTIKQAWHARSTKRAGWRIILPLALVAIDDAEQVSMALKARGGINPDDPQGRHG